MKITPAQQIIGRQLLAASQQHAEAKRLGKIPGNLAQGIAASLQSEARRKVADLVNLSAKYPIAKDDAPGSDWSLIAAFGLSREQLPPLFKSYGLSDFDIKNAMADAAVAFDLLTQIAKQRSTQ